MLLSAPSPTGWRDVLGPSSTPSSASSLLLSGRDLAFSGAAAAAPSATAASAAAAPSPTPPVPSTLAASPEPSSSSGVARGDKVPLLSAKGASAGGAAAAAGSAAAASGPFAAAVASLQAAFSQASRPAASSAQSAAAPAAGVAACTGAAGGAGVAQWAAAAGPAHCLVLDADRLTAGSDEEVQMKAILAASSEDVLELVLRWMPSLRGCGAVCAWVEAPLRRLHVNLPTHAALADALVAAPLLVRCGSLPAAAWRGAGRVCGLQRHALPEMLQLTCVPTRPPQGPAAEQLQPELTRLLAAMQLHETCSWHPSSHLPSRHGVQSITLNVLPRHASLAALAATIERVHGKHELWGGVVRVHAPNTPSLTRCRDCAQLGHAVNACPRYAGVAWRLLFKQPQSYASMQGLCALLQASDGYVGHAAGLYIPHRKVTLLFRIDPTDDAAVQQMVNGCCSSLRSPAACSTSRRLPCRRGTACASAASATASTTRTPAPSRRRSRLPCAPGRSSSSSSAAASTCGTARVECSSGWRCCRRPAVPSARLGFGGCSSAAARPPPPAKPGMCKSWHKTKSCPRMQSGQRCGHAHPADHQPPHCFEFAKSGSCSRRDNCRFPHIAAAALQLQQQPAPAPAPAAAPPAPVPQPQADGAADMEMSMGDGAPAPVAPVAAVAATVAAAATRQSGPPAPAAAPSRAGSATSAAAAAAPPTRAPTSMAHTSNPFAALQDDGAVAPKPPAAAPATPKRSSSRVAAAATAVAPPSSLSALTSPSAQTSTTASKKRKGTGEPTEPDPKGARRNLAGALSGSASAATSVVAAAAGASADASKRDSSASGH